MLPGHAGGHARGDRSGVDKAIAAERVPASVASDKTTAAPTFKGESPTTKTRMPHAVVFVAHRDA